MPLYALVLLVVSMFANIHAPVVVMIEHAVIEPDSEQLFHLVLDLAQQRRVVVRHIDRLSAVFQDKGRVGSERCVARQCGAWQVASEKQR